MNKMLQVSAGAVRSALHFRRWRVRWFWSSIGSTMISPVRWLFLSIGGCATFLGVLMVRCAPASSSFPEPTTLPTMAGPRADEASLYDRTIVVAAGAKPALREAAAALAAHLQKATGTPFRLVSQANRGIFLTRSDSAQADPDAAARLHGRGPEAYVIRSKGDQRLDITANSEDGLIFGAYQYLERLGVRFYFPGEDWTIVPRLTKITLRVDELTAPRFRQRGFFGTGGFGGVLAIDPGRDLAKRWALWQVENGFGGEFRVGGHIGEAFNLAHQQTLQEHPEYLASVNGRRVWSKGAKLDPTNPQAVELFVNDRLNAYRAQRNRDPNGPGAFAVSVEPADGPLDCNSPECLRLGGPSEQQFFLANAVARALAREFPGARASLLAYNKHADVPQIPLEPNVYVTVVPYAFRAASSLSPEALIDAWLKKTSPIGLYDYWSIPDWTADLPEFDYTKTAVEKVRFWAGRPIEGVGIETTYSAGAMGLPLYITAHLLWDPSRDPAKLADEFFRDCFEAAQAPMRRMLQRWSIGFILTETELQASFSDLAEAFERSPSAPVTRRLVAYAGYLEYLRLRYAWANAEPSEEPTRRRALLIHLWRIHSSGMVHSLRLHQLLVRGQSQLAAEFAPQNRALPIWSQLPPWNEGVARQTVHDALRELAPSNISVKTFAGELVTAEGRDVAASVAPAATSITLLGPSRLELSIPEGMKELTLLLQIGAHSVVTLSARGEPLASAQLEANPSPSSFSAPLHGGGTYELEITAPKLAKTTLSAPPEVGVELQDFRVPKPAPATLYFFVPRGETRVGVYSRVKFSQLSVEAPQLLDGSGTRVPTAVEESGHLLAANVPPGQDARVWTLRGVVSPSAGLRLLNAPQRFALSRSALRVPRGALERGRSAPADIHR